MPSSCETSGKRGEVVSASDALVPVLAINEKGVFVLDSIRIRTLVRGWTPLAGSATRNLHKCTWASSFLEGNDLLTFCDDLGMSTRCVDASAVSSHQ